MKTIKYLNTIAIGIPLALAFLSLIDNGLMIITAYSTMITGLLQIIIGIVFWFKHKENSHIKVYFFLVTVFFSLWYYNTTINYNDALTWTLLFTPLVLCIYISITIYSQKEKL